LNHPLFLALVVTFFSFQVQSKAQSCLYSFDLDKSLVQGTGYKFTDKLGVTATFAGVELNSNKAQKNKKDLFNGLVVSVDLLSIDSENGLRDMNMRETLFANILGDSKVTVAVEKVTDKKIETKITVNQNSQKVLFDYKMTDSGIEAKGLFDALKFALGDQIAALKKRCGSLHTGDDGKSVTWTDFDLEVKAYFKKTCS